MRVTINSRLEEVRVAAQAVRDFCAQEGVDRELAGVLELAVVEAANNAVLHAYDGREAGPVRVEMSRQGDELVFAITDWGQAFDLEACLAQTRRRPAGSGQENGRGLIIMTEVMDAMDYTSAGGANTLRLRKRSAGE